jgi:uncharacterized protein (DUF433 family)
MTLKELEPQLLQLNNQEKAQVIQILSQSLANNIQGVEKNPDVCGGKACIANTRIPVWGLVNARRLGYSEVDLLQNYPGLSAIDLVNAWNYAETFNEEIERDIQENEDDE